MSFLRQDQHTPLILSCIYALTKTLHILTIIHVYLGLRHFTFAVSLACGSYVFYFHLVISLFSLYEFALIDLNLSFYRNE
jgi:membrane-bound metal-dependent hydrolase YbcI (DUF457 family)